MNLTDKGIAVAQIALAVTFVVGYFALLFCFMAGMVRIPADYKEMFSALLGSLTSGVGIILAYFFSRQRSGPT